MKTCLAIVGFGLKTALTITVVASSVAIGFEMSYLAIDVTKKAFGKLRKKLYGQTV